MKINSVELKKSKMGKDYISIGTSEGNKACFEVMKLHEFKEWVGKEATPIYTPKGYLSGLTAFSRDSVAGNTTQGNSIHHPFISPENNRQRSIMAQTAVKCACELAIARNKLDLVDITVSANQLLKLMEDMSK